MLKLSGEAFERARKFIGQKGRPLEQALFAHHFEAPCADDVVLELARFQNPDGGFGHAIEPDFRLPESSVMATTVGLQVAVDLGLDASRAVVENAVGYLARSFDAALDAWPSAPSSVNDHAHAPWWHQDPSRPHDASALRLNPGVEVAAYVIRWGAANYDGWLRKAIESSEALEPHQLLCCVRLAQTQGLACDIRETLTALIRQCAAGAIATDASQWGSYCIKPLAAAPSPDSLLASQFAEAIERQLDYEIEHQSEDGAWLPHWTWGDSYPDEWEVAKREWSGEITLKTLRALAAFDRCQDIHHTIE